MSIKSPNEKLARWAIKLQSYDIQIKYTLKEAQQNTEHMQDRNRQQFDPKRRPDPGYSAEDKILVTTHPLSNAEFSAKFAPKRDGPYIIMRRHGPASYQS